MTSFKTRYGILDSNIRVYEDDNCQSEQPVLVGYTSKVTLDAGVFYAPYIPLQTSSVVYKDYNFEGNLTVGGTITINGTLKVDGDVVIGGRLFTPEDVEYLAINIPRMLEEERLRAEYPSLEAAWTAYQMTLKMVRDSDSKNIP